MISKILSDCIEASDKYDRYELLTRLNGLMKNYPTAFKVIFIVLISIFVLLIIALIVLFIIDKITKGTKS